MKKQMFKKILLYFIAVIFIIFNYTSFYYSIDGVSKVSLMVVPLLLTLPIFIYILILNRTIDYRSMAIAVLLISNILLSTIIANDMSAEIYMLISAIFVAFVVANILEKQQFIDCYVNLMLFFAVCSLIATYVIMPLDIENGFGIFPIIVKNNQSYFNMFVTICIRMYGIARNCGFCREPGVYQIFLLFAVYFVIEHQEKSKANIVKAVFLIITLLSTFSAVCYIIAPICVFMLMKKYIKNMRTFVKTIIITILCVVLFVLIIGSNTDIVREFERTILKWNVDNQSDSLEVRTSGVLSNLDLFFEKPVFGYGLTTSWHEVIARSGFEDVTGTTFIGFAAFGIVFGLAIHYMMLKTCKTKNMVFTIIWFFMILLSTLSQNMIISNLFWILIFFSFMREAEPALPEKEPVEQLTEEQESEDDDTEQQDFDQEFEIPHNLKLDDFIKENNNESN